MFRTPLLILLISLVSLSFGQSFRFNQYTTEDGISQNFIYSINQDKNGYLWVGTGEGLCKFDGIHFETFTTQDGLSEDVITCSFVDKNGTQWFGHNEGGITKFNKKDFTAIKRAGLIESKINDISGVGDQVFGVAQNHGLFEIKNDKLDLIGTFGLEGFHAIQCVDDKNILIGTSTGLLHLKFNGNIWTKQDTYLKDQWITFINNTSKKGVYLMAMQSGGISKVRIENGKVEFSKWDSSFDLSEIQIQTILEDQDKNIWLGTYGQGLIKLHLDTLSTEDYEITKYNTTTGMASDFVQSVYQDREGNIWVGTFGAGLSTLIDDFFTFYSQDENKYNNNVSAICVVGSQKWYGVDDGLIKVSSLDTVSEFYNSSNGFVSDKVTSLFLNDSVMWIGTWNNGMYSFDLRTEKFKKIGWNYGSLQNKINQITGNETSIFVGTEGGLVVYYIKESSTNLFDTQLGLAHNSIKSVCIGSEGTIWMGTVSRYLFGINNNTIDEYEITNGGQLEIVSISEDQEKNIWIATAENGVYKKTGNSFAHYSTLEGLKSNYTYAANADSEGNIWVGHRGGLSKIPADAGKIIVYDHTSGIEDQVNPRAMFLDNKNYLWIGTDGGTIKYDPSKDKEKIVPPVVNLLSVMIGEKEYGVDEKIKLPYGNYRVQFDFIGISFKDPLNVKYQYKLEGYDEVYSDYTHEPNATYGRLADGKYKFHVMACNEDGICSEDTATIEITIAKPFWKTIWFYFLVAVVLIGTVILIVRIRVKRLQANQIYLEEQLEIKTKEVVDKAKIIQEINKDLTASINYAERIQSAILPDVEMMSNLLPNSFIFFRPRDIVSGDFYFLRKYKDKLIVACVDCTGHGVPGAFMSMIGSTTLRNIYKLMDSTGNWMTPDKVLDLLDEEIQKILHQRSTGDIEEDFFKSRDGMDMTLCEINLNTNEVLLSSAKRHSIIMQNDEISIISGDKRPIGGGEIDQVDFHLQKFQMNKGDTLFLFSDGYPDQFGGEHGRKMKISGVKNMIESMQNMDAIQYSKEVQETFDNWKGSKEQIDDVLIVGLVFLLKTYCFYIAF